MKKQWATWNWIAANLQRNIATMLLYVVESSGSSPGRQGFFMAVNANGEMMGSVGGGIMEHKFVEMAKTKLEEDALESSIYKQYHNKSSPKHQSGMICSGEQTLLLLRIQQKDLPAIQQLLNSLQQSESGTLRLLPDGLYFNASIPDVAYSFSQQSPDSWSYTEKTGIHNHLYIIGGGHCSLAFSGIMSSLDFFIHLYDDREGLNTLTTNSFADEKRVINDYSLLAEHVKTGNQSFVVVMTFGYRTDYIALKSLLPKQFRYLGVLGSKKKIEKVLADLTEEGFTANELSRLYAPAGIPIKSETPEEIAISIAAEIIRVKNMGE